MSSDDTMVKALKNDPRTVELSAARRAMVDYVICLTETPWAVDESMIIAMREQGLSDEAISVTNLVACFFAWCNRVVDGLGVQLEDYWPEAVRADEERVRSTPPGQG